MLFLSAGSEGGGGLTTYYNYGRQVKECECLYLVIKYVLVSENSIVRDTLLQVSSRHAHHVHHPLWALQIYIYILPRRLRC